MVINPILAPLILISGILCIIRPILLLYLFSALPILAYFPAVSNDSAIYLFRIGSVNIFAQDYLIIILATLVLCCCIYFLFNYRHFLSIVFSSPITRIILILFVWEFFIGILSYTKGFEIQNVLRRLSIYSLMYIAILMPFIKNIEYSKERFFKYITLLAIFLSFLAFFRFAVTQNIEYTSSMTQRTLLGNTVIIFLFPISYFLFYKCKDIKLSLFNSIIIIVLLVGIVFTGHRSGILSFFFLLCLWLSKNKFLSREFVWIPIFGFTFLMIFLLIIPLHLKLGAKMNPGKSFLGDVVIRYIDTFDTDNKTTVERLSKWQYSFEIAVDSPLLGLARFPYYTGNVNEFSAQNLSQFSELNRAPHNIFANKLIHEGALGLCLFIAFISIVIHQLNKMRSGNDCYISFLKSYILCFIFFSLFNETLSNPVGLTFFSIILGFLNIEIVKKKLSTEQHNKIFE